MEHIPRGHNFIKEELSKLVARRELVPTCTFVEQFTWPLIDLKIEEGLKGHETRVGASRTEAPPECAVMFVAPGEPAWAKDILGYLRHQALPEHNAVAERITRQAKM